MCQYCDGTEDINTSNEDFSIEIENGVIEIYHQNPYNFHDLQSAKINIYYCPMCGEKLIK